MGKKRYTVLVSGVKIFVAFDTGGTFGELLEIVKKKAKKKSRLKDLADQLTEISVKTEDGEKALVDEDDILEDIVAEGDIITVDVDSAGMPPEEDQKAESDRSSMRSQPLILSQRSPTGGPNQQGPPLNMYPPGPGSWSSWVHQHQGMPSHQGMPGQIPATYPYGMPGKPNAYNSFGMYPPMGYHSANQYMHPMHSQVPQMDTKSQASPKAFDNRYSPDHMGRDHYSPQPTVKDIRRPSLDLQVSDVESEGLHQHISSLDTNPGEELEDGLRVSDLEHRVDSKVHEQAAVDMNLINKEKLVPDLPCEKTALDITIDAETWIASRRHNQQCPAHQRNGSANVLPGPVIPQRMWRSPELNKVSNDLYRSDSNLSVPGGRKALRRRERRTSSNSSLNKIKQKSYYTGEGNSLSADFDQPGYASDSVLPGIGSSYIERSRPISIPRKTALRNSNGRAQNRLSSSIGNDEELNRLSNGELSPGKPSLRKSRKCEYGYKKPAPKSQSGEWFGKGRNGPRRESSLRFAFDDDNTNKQSRSKPHRRSKSTDTESPRRATKSGRRSRVTPNNNSAAVAAEPQSSATSTSNPRLQFNRSSSARNLQDEDRGRGKVKSRGKERKKSMPQPGMLDRSSSVIEKKEESISKFKRSASMGNLNTKDEKGKKLTRSRSRTELKQLLVERGRSRSKSGSRRRSLSRSRSRSRSREGSIDLDDDMGSGRKTTYRFGKRTISMIMPSDLPDADELKERPDKWLRLEHIHGYSGFEALARQNLFLRDGCLIYYIACAGVVHSIKSNTQKFFLFHDEDISSITVHPSLPMVASGQQTVKGGNMHPKIWIWDYTSCRQIKLIDQPHDRAVEMLEFSACSNFLYSIGGDENHNMKVWKVSDFSVSGTPKPIGDINLTKSRLLGLTINPYGKTVAQGCIDSFITFGRKHAKYWEVKRFKSSRSRGDAKFAEVSIDGHNMVITAHRGKKNELSEKAFHCARFMPEGTCLVGGHSGVIYLTRGSELVSKCKVHDGPIGDIFVSSDGYTVISAGWDGNLISNPLGKATRHHLTVPGMKNMSLQTRSITFDEETGYIYLGTKMNQIMRYRMRTSTHKDGRFDRSALDEKSPMDSLEVIIEGHGGETWGIASHPTKDIYVTGAHDGTLRLWCAETRAMINMVRLPNNDMVTCAAWSENGKYIACGTESSKIALLTYEPFKLRALAKIPVKTVTETEKIKHPGFRYSSEVACVEFSPFSDLIAVGHFDSNAYIYSIITSPKLTVKPWKFALDLTAGCTHLQFSTCGNWLKTFSKDYDIMCWTLDRDREDCEHHTYLIDPDFLKWSGDPIIAGYDVMGLYQTNASWDGSGLNCCSLAKGGLIEGDSQYVVSGDNFGTVRLFNYPAVNEDANWEFKGHGAFVVGCKFLANMTTLITVGGGDRSIFQWKLEDSAPEHWTLKQGKSKWQVLKEAIDSGKLARMKEGQHKKKIKENTHTVMEFD